MNKLRPLQGTILKLSAIVGLSLLATQAANADLFWVGGGADALNATSGTWDQELFLGDTGASQTWSNTSGGPANSGFAADEFAKFQGSVGLATVTTGSDLSVGSVDYTGGTFSIVNANTMTISSGITNNSGSVNRSITPPAIWSFQVAISGADSVAITNGGVVSFEGFATGGNASLSTTGDVRLEGLFNSGVTLNSLTVQNAGQASVSDKTLTLSNTLSLQNGSTLNFNIGTGVDGSIDLLGGSTFNGSGLGGVSVSLALSSVLTPGTYSLITFDVTTILNDVQASDFVLDPSILAQGVYGSFVINNINHSVDLTLVAVPEVSSALLPLLGAAALLGIRRRTPVRVPVLA